MSSSVSHTPNAIPPERSPQPDPTPAAGDGPPPRGPLPLYEVPDRLPPPRAGSPPAADLVDPDELDAMLKRLCLPAFRRHVDPLIADAEQHQYSYRAFLAMLCAEELAARHSARINRAVKAAQFPELVTIDDLDFTYQTSIRLRQLGSYLDASLITEGRCAIFLGSSGNAKTALAVAIAYRAIQNGFTARFIPAHALITTLATAAAEGQLEAALTEFVTPAVLVIDELGYLTPRERDAANVLYRIVDQRHRLKKPMLITTNKALAAWGTQLHDGDLAGAIIDRILARGQLYELRGLSYRTRHIPPEKLGIDPTRGAGSPRTRPRTPDEEAA